MVFPVSSGVSSDNCNRMWVKVEMEQIEIEKNRRKEALTLPRRSRLASVFVIKPVGLCCTTLPTFKQWTMEACATKELATLKGDAKRVVAISQGWCKKSCSCRRKCRQLLRCSWMLCDAALHLTSIRHAGRVLIWPRMRSHKCADIYRHPELSFAKCRMTTRTATLIPFERSENCVAHVNLTCHTANASTCCSYKDNKLHISANCGVTALCIAQSCASFKRQVTYSVEKKTRMGT